MAKQLRLNHKGQTIIGALIGIAIASISMLAIIAGLQFGQRGQNEIKYLSDLDNFNEEIRALLSDPVACTNSFGGKVAAVDQSYTISNLYDATAAPGVVRYTVGSVYGDNSLKLNSMTLKDYVAGAISTKAEMTLVSDVSSQKVNIGGKARPRTINLSLDLDATGKIVNCIALAKMSDGIWQRTLMNVNNIFFASASTSPTGGYVGIGTADPIRRLTVVEPSETAVVRIESASGANHAADLELARTGTGITWTLSQYDDDAFRLIKNSGLPGTINPITVDASGDVGIGVTTPGVPLEVSGFATNSSDAPASVQNINPEGTSSLAFKDISGSQKGAVGYGLPTGSSPWAGNVYLSTPDVTTPIVLVTHLQERVRVDVAGNVGIGTSSPTALLHVNGAALATAWNISSDIRLKENVKEIENPLDKILQLRGVEFDWRTDVNTPTKHDRPHDIGVVAQEVEKVFPEAVTSPEKGYKSVAYSKLIAPMIEAMKALYMRVTGVEADVAQLKARADKAEAENAALRADNKALRTDNNVLKADFEMLKARLAHLEQSKSH